MKLRVFNLLLAVMIIIPVGFTLTASRLFVNKNICRSQQCTEIHDMVSNSLYFPGSLMLIPLVLGIVIDSIGSLNIIIGSQILFFLGSLINSCLAAFAPSSQEDFYVICMIILSSFFIGVAVIGLKLGLFVFLANTFITKVSREIDPLTKSFFWFILAENGGLMLPQLLFDISDSEAIITLTFILCLILNLVSIGFVLYIYKKSREHAISIMESENTLDVEKLNYENTWIDQNNPVNQRKSEEEESYYKFLKEGGLIFAAGVISMSYLDSAGQYLPINNIINSDNHVPYVIVTYLPYLTSMGLAYGISKIQWDEFRLILANLGLFLLAEFVLGILRTEQDNTWTLMIGYSLFNGLQQPLFLFFLPFMIRLDLSNLGKTLGTIRWFGTLYVVFPIIFHFYVPLTLALIFLAYALLKKKEDMVWERQQELERKKKTLIHQENLFLLGSQIVGGPMDELQL